MKIDRLVFRYILDTNARFQALKSGEGQVMEPQPQLQIADFLKDKKFVGRTADRLRLGAHGHPVRPAGRTRAQAAVRPEALVTGINKPQIANALYGTIRRACPHCRATCSCRSEHVQEELGKSTFNQTKVIAILKTHGCTGGPDKPAANNSDIFSCPNVGKLSFRFETTTGNQLRALTFEIIQRQLKSVGIELVPRFQSGWHDVRNDASVE